VVELLGLDDSPELPENDGAPNSSDHIAPRPKRRKIKATTIDLNLRLAFRRITLTRKVMRWQLNKVVEQTRGDFEDDDISVCSTPSESLDGKFLIERILAEKKCEDGKMYFLVSWQDFDLAFSTWEPKENVLDPEMLQQWEVTKDQEARGLKATFNIAGFNDGLQEIALYEEDKRRRRKIKRKRLGFPVSPDCDEPDSVSPNKSCSGTGHIFVKPQAIGC
jgi:hypothetical protein